MNFDLPNDGVERKVLIDSERLQARIAELGNQLSVDYREKRPLFIGILKGSFVFLADLIRSLDPSVQAEVDFVTLSSYAGGQVSSRAPNLLTDTYTPVADRHVVIVEDIADTGHSLHTIHSMLEKRSPASLKTIALLSKPARREKRVQVDYVGFEIEDVWVEGYGMDTDELFRGLPCIVARTSK